MAQWFSILDVAPVYLSNPISFVLRSLLSLATVPPSTLYHPHCPPPHISLSSNNIRQLGIFQTFQAIFGPSAFAHTFSAASMSLCLSTLQTVSKRQLLGMENKKPQFLPT